MLPLSLLAKPTVILAILLAVSAGANVLLFKARDRALARVAAVEAERDNARAAAKACSDGTRRLRDEVATRTREIERALSAAREAARRAERRSDATLTTRPSAPGDACASGLDLSRKKVMERKP